MGNQILNSDNLTTINTDGSGNLTIHYNNIYSLYMNSNMSKFANGCGNLRLNLNTFNVNYAYVTNMYWAYRYCYNITGSPVSGLNVTDMSETYFVCQNLTGSPICGSNVTNMSSTYWGCSNLTGAPVCGNNVTYMASTYLECFNLTGSPVCGPNVNNMYRTYENCYNLTGWPACGCAVVDMNNTYARCNNLTCFPVCEDNVANMSMTYQRCSNLTGSPVCGNNVTNMYMTYINCSKLTGSPVCGPNVTNMYGTYANCPNLYGNMYMQSDKVYSCVNMLNAHNSQNRINIYVNAGTTSNSALYSNKVGCGDWTLDAANNMYYNAANNIYVYYGNIPTPTPQYNNINIVYLYDNTVLNTAINSKSEAYNGYTVITNNIWKILYITKLNNEGETFNASGYVRTKMFEINNDVQLSAALNSKENDGIYYYYTGANANNYISNYIYPVIYRVPDSNNLKLNVRSSFSYVEKSSTTRYNYYMAKTAVDCPYCEETQYVVGVGKPMERVKTCTWCSCEFMY